MVEPRFQNDEIVKPMFAQKRPIVLARIPAPSSGGKAPRVWTTVGIACAVFLPWNLRGGGGISEDLRGK